MKNMRGLGTIFGHEMKKIGKEKSLLLGFILLPVISLLLTVGLSIIQPKTEEDNADAYRMYFCGMNIDRYDIGTVENREIWIEPISGSAEDFVASPDFHKYDVLVDFSEVMNAPGRTSETAVKIYYNSNNSISNYLKMTAESFVRETFADIMKNQFSNVSFMEVQLKDIKEKEDSNRMIAMLLPYMLVLPLTANIANFASDTVAGDKARGSFFQVMLSPVKPLSLIMGKVLSVSTISLVSSGIYIGLDIVGSQICERLGKKDVFGFAGVHVSALQVFLIIVYAVFLSYFFSNLGVLISLFCRDGSQAQAAQIPVTLICTVSALMSMFRFGISPAFHYFIPVYNLCLIFQDLLNGRARLSNMISVAISLMVLAVGVLVITLLSYKNERVRT